MRLGEILEQRSAVQKHRSLEEKKELAKETTGVEGKAVKYCRKEAKRREGFKEKTTRATEKIWNKKGQLNSAIRTCSNSCRVKAILLEWNGTEKRKK